MNPNLMKSITLLVLLAGALLFGSISNSSHAAESAPSKWEYAVVKWDGPDRLYYNLPDSFELVYLRKRGIDIPKDAQEEQWCLAWAANDMAKTGWEAVNLDSRRILFRRLRTD